MTGKEGERLAVVETQVSEIRADVSEIKADVKILMAHRFQTTGVLTFFVRAIPFVALGVSIWVAVVR